MELTEEEGGQNRQAEQKSLTVTLFREDLVLIDLLRRPNESDLSVIRRALYDNFEFQMLKRSVNYLEKKVEEIASQKNSLEEEEFDEILEREKNMEKIRQEIRRGGVKNSTPGEDVPDFRGNKEKMKEAMERRWSVRSQIRRPETR